MRYSPVHSNNAFGNCSADGICLAMSATAHHDIDIHPFDQISAI